MHLRGIRVLAAVSGADMTIGVMCSLRGAQATEKAAQLGLLLMCRFFRNTSRLIFNKSPPYMGPLDLIFGQKPTRVGGFD